MRLGGRPPIWRGQHPLGSARLAAQRREARQSVCGAGDRGVHKRDDGSAELWWLGAQFHTVLGAMSTHLMSRLIKGPN